MRIVALEDDLSQAQLIQKVLAEEGFATDVFYEGSKLIYTLRKEAYDLFILDWEVPGMSGFEVLQWIRSNLGFGVPVIFVTSRTLEEDVITGLQAGADDYLVKPFRPAELIARIRSLLRRVYPERPVSETFSIGPLVIDPARQIITRNGIPAELTKMEFELASLLLSSLGRLVSKSELSHRIWGRDISPQSRTVDTHLSRVRIKLGLRPELGFKLSTVYGLGYRLQTTGDMDNSDDGEPAGESPGEERGDTDPDWRVSG